MRAFAVAVFFVLAALAAVGMAGAIPVIMTTRAVQLMSSHDGLQTVGIEPSGPVEVFQIGPGACLRGPLKIGAFALAAGVDYPAGCSAGTR